LAAASGGAARAPRRDGRWFLVFRDFREVSEVVPYFCLVRSAHETI